MKGIETKQNKIVCYTLDSKNQNAPIPYAALRARVKGIETLRRGKPRLNHHSSKNQNAPKVQHRWMKGIETFSDGLADTNQE